MKNSFFLSGLAAAFLGLGVVRGQEPTFPPGPPAGPPSTMPQLLPPPVANGNAHVAENGNGKDETAPLFLKDHQGGGEQHYPGVSSWLAYPRGPGCCCAVGNNGPIGSEIYLRTGVSVPFGSGVYASVLKPGWDIEGGLRALFFNRDCDAAWTADLSITNMHFLSNHNRSVTITNFPQTVSNGFGGTTTTNVPSIQGTPTELNDTFVNISGGREVYLWGAAACCHSEPAWRIGWDLGGRWGTSKAGLSMGANTVGEHHKTGSLAGVLASVHSDLEYPLGCWISFVGVRAEYGYIFSDILQSQNNANLQTVNLMFTIGGRF